MSERMPLRRGDATMDVEPKTERQARRLNSGILGAATCFFMAHRSFRCRLSNRRSKMSLSHSPVVIQKTEASRAVPCKVLGIPVETSTAQPCSGAQARSHLTTPIEKGIVCSVTRTG